MKLERPLAAVGLVALVMLLVGAGSSPVRSSSRPFGVEPGVVLAKVVDSTGVLQPERYRIERVDGPWIFVQVIKSKKKSKGEAYWAEISQFGTFKIME